ncbi:MAG TPA: hypothetical protein VMW74_09925 [Nitrosopumilaceae archaeon]|nr:hypothetical protein [Nitrosopumilaceae archaeon]
MVAHDTTKVLDFAVVVVTLLEHKIMFAFVVIVNCGENQDEKGGF